ncbi:MAG: hypothetical protein K9H49_18265 [Bacteroidales bacterium]|nr:hypothetical protein [Bacteroidales bacterium]MCF8391485.1 hypothetical protein [Bacteroidales bacterium]
MLKKVAYIIILILVFYSCKGPNNELNMPGYELASGDIQIPEEAMEDIIQNISSPIEMAALIKDLGLNFSDQYLSNLDLVDNYSSSFKMAYTLGMLGADLGYLNVYERTGSSVSYLAAINKLADGLKVSQFFDFNTIKRLATSNSNLDSLIFMSVHSFNEMDKHLQLTDRSNLSALMIAGVWIEGMFQVTQVSLSQKDPVLSEYIGEQKLILNNLLLILKNYERDDQFAAIIKDYEELKKSFSKVDITYEISDPEPVEQEDGMLMVVQQETSIISISDNVLSEIIEKTKTIRNKHQLL